MQTVKRWSGTKRCDWTVREFYRLEELQAFREQRVELIEGIIVEKEQESPSHVASRHLTRDALETAFGSGFWIRSLAPMRLSRRCLLNPDLAVVLGGPRGDMPTPTTALLVVEVSDETLGYDRRRKGSLYARAEIVDYWIVNLKRGKLETYRQPTTVPTCRYGFGYSASAIFGPDEHASPLAAPHARIKVADLLP